MIIMEDMLTIKDVARMLKYTDYYIRELCKSGQLKAVRIGGHWRIKPEDLRDFVEKQSQSEDKK